MNFGLKCIGYPNYRVWSDGTVTTLEGTPKSLITRKAGYQTVHLSREGKPKHISIHRLVMENFKGPSDLQVNHIDGDKANNCTANLEYVTAKENIAHAIRTGLCNPVGESNGRAKLTKTDVRNIRDLILKGVHKKEIAKKYNIALGYVYQLRDKHWSHID